MRWSVLKAFVNKSRLKYQIKVDIFMTLVTPEDELFAFWLPPS